MLSCARLKPAQGRASVAAAASMFTLVFLLAGAGTVHARLVDPFNPRLGDTEVIREPVLVHADPSASASVSPPRGSDLWVSPRAAGEELGELWYLSQEIVWYRVPGASDAAPDEHLSFNVPGELVALYVDDRRLSSAELRFTYSFVSIDAAALQSIDYVYAGIRRPLEHVRHVLRGPGDGHFGALSRYAGYRRSLSPPVPVEVAYFTDRRTPSMDWQPLTSDYLDTRGARSFAVRFALPERFRDAGITMLHQIALDGAEVWINGERYYGRGRGLEYQAPEANVHRSPAVTVVALPDRPLNDVQLRWHFPNERALRLNFFSWQANLGHLGFSIGPSEDMILVQDTALGFQQRHYVPAIGLALLSVALFVLGLARRGRGKRTFFFLSGLILAGVGAYLGNQMDDVVRLIPVLRSFGFDASHSLFFLCLYAVPPFLLFFFRSSTQTTVPQWQVTGGRVLIGWVTVFGAVQIVTVLVGGANEFVIWDTGPLGLAGYAVAWVMTLVLIVAHARTSRDRQINRYLLLFAGMLVVNGAFQIGAGAAPWVEMQVATFVRIRAGLFALSVVPLLAVPIIVYRRVEQGLENANEVFRKFVPDEFLRFLGINELNEIRAGQQIETTLTVMFCDIRGFTSIAEKMQPAQTMSFVNSYLELVGPIIRRNGGFVDKYLGDGVMALFPGDGVGAAQAALEIVAGMTEMSDGASARVGIGLHRGPAMLGTVGEHDRLDTTVIADAVNTASRLQALSAAYGCDVLATDTSMSDNGGHRYYTRFVDAVRLKGKEQAVTVVEVRPAEAVESRQRGDELYRSAFDALARQDVAEASRLAEQCRAIDPDDPVYAMLDDRVRYYSDRGFPDNWDGITDRRRK